MSIVYNLCDDCLHKDTCHGENSDSLMTCFQRKEECTSLKPKTNADRIRSMTDEELAEFLHLTNDCCCDYVMKRRCPDFDKCGVECWLDWLKEEVKE